MTLFILLKGEIEDLELLSEISDKSFYRFNYLLVFRWVGIDAMILVTRNKEILGMDLFKESLKEKFDQKSISFYESKFGIYEKDHYQSSNLRKGNTLPGLLAFLFFSGSHVFLYISIIFFCLIANLNLADLD